MSLPVAIVHDWLTSMRGGERVVEVLCRVFPQADLFTLTWDPGRLSPALAQRSPTTSPIHCLANAPFVSGRFRGLLPLFPLAVESFKLDRYALVVSSSHCVAIGAIAPPTALHVAYVHSTLRYVREAQQTYEASIPGARVGRALFRGTAHYLRRWETAAAARPHLLIANSTYTRERIRRYFQRDALVIEPPIDTDRFERAAAGSPRPDAEAPFLLVSALVPNKRVDLALHAFRGRPERLLVVGDGPERERLERLAGPNVVLSPRVDEAALAGLYAGCRALLHTGVDDFGMVMVEALAAGKPVIACAEGGARDIVRDGETGLLIEAPTVESVRVALDRFASLPQRLEPAALQTFARRFDRANFERRFAEAVEDAWRQRRNSHANGAGAHASSNGAHASSNGAHASSNGAQASSNGAHSTPNGGPSGSGRSHGPMLRLADPVVATTTDPNAVQRLVDNFSPVGLATKRLVDVTLAAAGLVMAAPLLVGLGALIPLDSAGPALFRQCRTGLHQRPFTLVKLRTMNAKGEVTRVGRLLRPLGLDELPQLWNVLKGDMSLVGPRPEVPERVERFQCDLPGYGARHLVRPGITGWAQVNRLRGNAASIAERLRFDIQYLREWSLALDGRILMRTASAVWGDTVRELRG
jgi:lipopolysaccharide/colanic/teichoic acid biosynthesis glycosyltransferase/glycosyltransferase involved in cell wall biosynthesis